MSKLMIPYLKELEKSPLADVSTTLETAGLRLPVMTLNWREEFPYLPITTVTLGHSGEALYLSFYSRGVGLLCKGREDGAKVHKDCCLEAFLQVPGRETYYNLEFNACGVCDATERKSRSESEPFTPEEYAAIKRYSSVREWPDATKQEEVKEVIVTVRVPFGLLKLTDVPQKLLANFYKCGDETIVPHFCTWAPVGTVSPDFHQPAYFRPLYLEI